MPVACCECNIAWLLFAAVRLLFIAVASRISLSLSFPRLLLRHSCLASGVPHDFRAALLLSEKISPFNSSSSCLSDPRDTSNGVFLKTFLRYLSASRCYAALSVSFSLSFSLSRNKVFHLKCHLLNWYPSFVVTRRFHFFFFISHKTKSSQFTSRRVYVMIVEYLLSHIRTHICNSYWIRMFVASRVMQIRMYARSRTEKYRLAF